MLGTLLAVMTGLAQGARHAFEPDHLVAVSTLTTRAAGRGHALWLGATWGLGHSLSILLVGGALTLAGVAMPASLATGFELGVAAVLLFLGFKNVRAAWQAERGGPSQVHRHGGHSHTHSTRGEHVHVHSVPLAVRPLTVGIVHGLAGTGALTAALVVQLPSAGDRLLYLVLFGLGSVVGMGTLTALAAPLLGRLSDKAMRRTSGLAGVLSLLAGLAWGVLALT